MSGIAGIHKHNERDLIVRMLESIGHRGDAEPTVLEIAGASIGAIRFSVLGEEPGPIFIPGDDRAILMDGNLLGRQDLRPEIALHRNRCRGLLHSCMRRRNAAILLSCHDVEGPERLCYISVMKLTAKVKLKPTSEQVLALNKRTIQQANAACDCISNCAWEARAFRQFDLHRLVYHDVRAGFGFAASEEEVLMNVEGYP